MGEGGAVPKPPSRRASKRDAPSALVPPLAPSTGRCLGGDAFEKISVSKWTPPVTARLEQIQQWQSLKAASDAAIKAFPRGGKELRAFVHEMVQKLRLQRHNMFCAHLPIV